MIPFIERKGERGQLIVLFALALVAVIAMAGLLIDGSALLAQQRTTQNATDAAATAGGLVIADALDSETVHSNHDVYVAVQTMAGANKLTDWTAEYTGLTGVPSGTLVTNDGSAIDSAYRGVLVTGTQDVATTFSRVIGINSLPVTAAATVLAGPTSTECAVDEDGCTILPVTFPVMLTSCGPDGELDGAGTWVGAPPPGSESDGYWPIVGMDALPSATNPTGDLGSLAILPLCRGSGGSSGAFGWLDLDPGISNLAGEINGPITTAITIPDWFQTQPGNPNSVEDELEQYIHTPVLIPLYNNACRVDPGDGVTTCPAGQEGVGDPNGNNTWYYVHTIAVFYPHQVLVQGSNQAACASPPGSPLVPVTHGAGFLGCLKGWFVKYVISGPINPGGDIESGAIGIQLIH